MKDESDIREIRAEIVAVLKELDGKDGLEKTTWRKLEAAEVALDYVLEDNDILEEVVKNVQ